MEVDIDTPHEYEPLSEYDADCKHCGEPESLHHWPGPPMDPELLCCYGILLMVAVKGVGVGLMDLDADAWYVWPWTWVAFGMMAPAVVGWINDARERF